MKRLIFLNDGSKEIVTEIQDVDFLPSLIENDILAEVASGYYMLDTLEEIPRYRLSPTKPGLGIYYEKLSVIKAGLIIPTLNWKWGACDPYSVNIEGLQKSSNKEPECLCDSWRMTAIGHDENCKYLAWKNRTKSDRT